MRTLALLACGTLLFTACATPPPRSVSAPDAVTEPTPVCSTTRQCEVMWHAAREAAQLISGMKIRTMSDSFLDTFEPRDSSKPAVTVTKYPLGEERYEFRAQMVCRGECADIRARGTNLFNSLVTTAGAQAQ